MFSGSTPVKQEEEEKEEEEEEEAEEDGKMGIFYNLMKLNAISLNNCWGI